MASSRTHENYSKEVETAVNQLIAILFDNEYAYHVMQNHFYKDEVAFKGVRTYFKTKWMLTLREWQILMKVQIERGGQVVYPTVKAPAKTQFQSIQEVLQQTLENEKRVYQAFMELHILTVKVNEPHIMNVVRELLQEKTVTLRIVSEHLTTLQRLEGKMGEFMFDQFLQEEMKLKKIQYEEVRGAVNHQWQSNVSPSCVHTVTQTSPISSPCKL